MVSSRRLFKYFLFVFVVFLICFIIMGFQVLTEVKRQREDDYPDYGEENSKPLSIHDEMEQAAINPDKINKPIILWWTPFTGEKGKYKTCGKDSCFFTVDRKFRNHPLTKVFMFYGSDMKFEELPLPRRPHHEWALFHEESPKNSYYFSHAEVMTMFNHTSTFRRESDYPITTQHLVSLDWLENPKYLCSIEDKNLYAETRALIMYAHSDCDPPSDRDTYVKLLMKEIQVDSYGFCLHNKNLPDHLQDPLKGMDHTDFYRLVGRYKFSLAMENGVCTDYITEKLWRPLMAGSVPIIYGSPTVMDLLPSNHSAILINNFESVKELAAYIKYLDENDEEYEKYLQWRKTGVTNPILKNIMDERKWSIDSVESWNPYDFNFIDGFECFVCNRLHENIQLKNKGKATKQHQATVEHYGCPKPLKFSKAGDERKEDLSWQSEWELHGRMAKVLRHFVDNNMDYTKGDLMTGAFKDMY